MSTPKIRPSDYPFAGTPTATPRTDNAWRRYNSADQPDPQELAKEMIALETELAAVKAECERLRPHSLSSGEREDYHDALNELARLRAELAVAENWVEHHSKHADDLIGENVKLRADLERFTGHGLLDCHAICDQRDAAVAECDRLRAEVERLKDCAFDKDGTPWKTVCGWWSAKYDAAERQMGENATRAERAEVERDQLRAEAERLVAENNKLNAETNKQSFQLGEATRGMEWQPAYKELKARAERAEAALTEAIDGVIDGGSIPETLLVIHIPRSPVGYRVGQPVKVILPAIDAAMKEGSK